MILSALLLPAPAFAAGALRDLRIPVEPPWEDPRGTPPPPQEDPPELFWGTLRRDLAAVALWRDGLTGVLEEARRSPQVFPPRPVQRPSLFEEYREEARGLWVAAMDFWLALEWALDRYGALDAWPQADRRRGAGLAACAAYLALARFAKDWTALAANDPLLERLFDEAVPELGLPAGSYRRLKARFGTGGGLEAAAVKGFWRELESRPELGRALKAGRWAWVRARQRDARDLPRAAEPRAERLQAAFAGTFRPVSAPFTGGPAPKAAGAAQPDWLVPRGDDAAVPYAVRLTRRWLALDGPLWERPDSLVSLEQVRALARRLAPGDILLARRGGALTEIGRAGYWHAAGLFLGDVGEAGPSVARSAPGGTVVEPLERFAAADAAAALRPRLGAAARRLAALRALSEAASPRRGLDGIGVIREAYRPAAGSPGLALAPAGMGSAHDLARRFDAEFGTPGQSLDLIEFFDEDEPARRARRAAAEEFRRSGRRPKWRFAVDKESTR